MKIPPIFAAVLMASTTAFGAEPDEGVGAKRAAMLGAIVKDFRLRLSYHGDSDKPYYSLLLSVPQVNLRRSDAFSLVAQQSEAQALKIISHLANSGILDRALEKPDTSKWPQPAYRLRVMAGEMDLTDSLGWNLETLRTLDGLRKSLDGEAAKEMDVLLGRLSGHRAEWEAAEKKEVARLNEFYPNGFHFIDTLRPDGKILWITKEVVAGKVKAQRKEIASFEDFKKAFLGASVNKSAAIEVHVRFVQIEGATKRAEAILGFLQAQGYTKAGAVSN